MSEENDDLNLIETMAENLNMRASAADAEDFEANVAVFTKDGLGAILERVAKQWREVRERLAAAERENIALRQGMSNVATNIGNGAAAAPNCTLEFLAECVPREVKLVCDDLRKRLTRAEADGAAMREALEEVHDELDTTRIRENGLEVIVPQSDWIALDACRSRIAALLASDHPGADLLARLAELEARLAGAMGVVEAAKNHRRSRISMPENASEADETKRLRRADDALAVALAAKAAIESETK